MRSIFISRTVYNRQVYFAFKKAGKILHRPGDSTEQFHQRIYEETGCRVVERHTDQHGYFKSAVLEFERDADFTMFMLKWS